MGNTATYQITAIAMDYCDVDRPANARRRFNYVLRTYPELWEELKKANYHTRQRYFTPKQYELVVRFLGEP